MLGESTLIKGGTLELVLCPVFRGPFDKSVGLALSLNLLTYRVTLGRSGVWQSWLVPACKNVGSVKPAVIGGFAPQKLLNIQSRAFPPGEPVVRHILAHCWAGRFLIQTSSLLSKIGIVIPACPVSYFTGLS